MINALRSYVLGVSRHILNYLQQLYLDVFDSMERLSLCIGTDDFHCK